MSPGCFYLCLKFDVHTAASCAFLSVGLCELTFVLLCFYLTYLLQGTRISGTGKMTMLVFDCILLAMLMQVLSIHFISNVKPTLNYFFFFFCSNNPTHKYFMAVDPVSGALFISDTNSRRIYRVRSLAGGRLLSDNAEVVAGTGEQCLPFDERCGDGGKATEATLMSPKGEPRSLVCYIICCDRHLQTHT